MKSLLDLQKFPNRWDTVFIQNKQQAPAMGYVRRRRRSCNLQCIAACRFEFQLEQAADILREWMLS